VAIVYKLNPLRYWVNLVVRLCKDPDWSAAFVCAQSECPSQPNNGTRWLAKNLMTVVRFTVAYNLQNTSISQANQLYLICKKLYWSLCCFTTVASEIVVNMAFQWFDVLVLPLKVTDAVLCTLQKQVVKLITLTCNNITFMTITCAPSLFPSLLLRWNASVYLKD